MTDPKLIGVEQADIDIANDYLSSAVRCTATLAQRFHRHRLLGIEQGRAEMREEAAKVVDTYDGPEWRTRRRWVPRQEVSQAIRAIPIAKDRPDAG